MKSKLIFFGLAVVTGCIGYAIGISGKKEIIIEHDGCKYEKGQKSLLLQSNREMTKQIDSLNREIEQYYDLIYELMPHAPNPADFVVK